MVLQVGSEIKQLVLKLLLQQPRVALRDGNQCFKLGQGALAVGFPAAEQVKQKQHGKQQQPQQHADTLWRHGFQSVRDAVEHSLSLIP